MSTFERVPGVRLRLDRSVAWIVQDRPHVLNAWDLGTLEQFGRALEACTDPDVRVVVISGAGRAFSAGGDVRAFASRIDGDPSAYIRALASTMHRLIILPIRRLTKPVIACLNGIAVGGGLSLALACDLRIAAASARLMSGYASVGLAADGGATHFLPRLVGSARAAELLFSSDAIDAQRALDLGLVNRVVPDDDLEEATMEWAAELAAKPAGSLAEQKSLLAQTWDSDLVSQLAKEVDAMARQAAGAEFREGVNAFIEKRPAKFG
jgi:2-(1,2-epoxy-1,2-dihydrophenyl)acetyl-CoA isomerase